MASPKSSKVLKGGNVTPTPGQVPQSNSTQGIPDSVVRNGEDDKHNEGPTPSEIRLLPSTSNSKQSVSSISPTIPPESVGGPRDTDTAAPTTSMDNKENLSGWGSFFGGIINYIRRLFSFPLVKDPISFARPGDYTPAGDADKSVTTHVTSDSLEVLCSYDKATKELFEHILKDRKEARAVKDNYHFLQVDLSKFPGWNETVIDRLRSTFQVFDISGDGLVDFDELSAILTEFGDTSSLTERRKFFEEVDTENSGAIDFMDFITMVFNITVKNASDPAAEILADSYRAIDRNMARIRSLDVVQQLQAGLF